MNLMPQLQQFPRGTTVRFATTFLDASGNPTIPSAAFVHVNYQQPPPGNLFLDFELSMTPPVPPSSVWVALWDTRNVGEGTVAWSVRSSGGGVPFAVMDGMFQLTANPANQVNFS